MIVNPIPVPGLASGFGINLRRSIADVYAPDFARQDFTAMFGLNNSWSKAAALFIRLRNSIAFRYWLAHLQESCFDQDRCTKIQGTRSNALTFFNFIFSYYSDSMLDTCVDAAMDIINAQKISRHAAANSISKDLMGMYRAALIAVNG